MSTSRISGNNFEVDGATLTVFEDKGFVMSNGNWATSSPFTHGMMVEEDPQSIMESVREAIDADVKAGRGDDIAQLQLSPRYALSLFLEGTLTATDFRRAVESDGFIDIPDVDINGRKLTVRIIGNPEYKCATADSDGNII